MDIDYTTLAYECCDAHKYDEAVEYFLRSINSGIYSSYVSLGMLYMHKFKDYEKAKIYYELAYKHKTHLSCYRLGNYYETIEKDIDKSVIYYNEGIQYNCCECYNSLAVYYSSKDDCVKALEMYKKAYKYGKDSAVLSLATMTNNICSANLSKDKCTFEQYLEDLKIATLYAKKAIDKHITIDGAEYIIMFIYYFAIKDIENAFYYLNESSKLGNIKPNSYLAFLYAAIKIDYNKAKEHLILAFRCNKSEWYELFSKVNKAPVLIYDALMESELSDSDKAEFIDTYLHTKDITKFANIKNSMPTNIIDHCKTCDLLAAMEKSKTVFCKYCYLVKCYPENKKILVFNRIK